MSALRVGIVGFGPRGLEHAHAIGSAGGLELAAVADPVAERRREAGERFGVEAFATVEEMAAGIAPEIVVVATPPRGRPELLERVAAAPGVRAIVAEKPLALDLEGAEREVRLCEERDVVLAVSHQSRYSPPFLRAKALIDSGELGRLERLNGVCFGPMLDQGNHLVDALRWFAGSEVSWVMSQAEDDRAKLAPHLAEGVEPWTDEEHPSPAWMTHHLGFENGVRATMETGFLYQRSEPFIGDWLQRRVAAIGTEGVAECRVSGLVRVISRSGVSEEPDEIERIADSTVALHEDVGAALRDGTPVRASGSDAVETLRVVLACLESSSQRGLVSLR